MKRLIMILLVVTLGVSLPVFSASQPSWRDVLRIAEEFLKVDGSNADPVVTATESVILQVKAIDYYGVIDRDGKDANGIFTDIEYYDSQATPTLRFRSLLSGGTTPEYTYRTVYWYDDTGTLVDVATYTQSYDVDGDWIGETK
jgi:hypothetical protein